MPASRHTSRRDALRLASLGGVVFASSLLRGITGCSSATGVLGGGPRGGNARGAEQDFFFLQLSDTHWGFSGPKYNPEADLELPTVIAAINAAHAKPDFVMFTGDLTHTTDDIAVRRQQMTDFKRIVSGLDVAMVKFIPGEHDAGSDGGATYKEFFGDLYYSFDHRGIHFVALDNASDPRSNLGGPQLAWLQSDLASLDVESPIVVFAHRPLWDLRAEWDWTTPDGQKAIDLLTPFLNVTVFFGHIHQELHRMTGRIPHHSARSLMFAFPSPDSGAGKLNAVPWDPANPNAGLGYRSIEATTDPADYKISEIAPPPHLVGDAGSQAAVPAGNSAAPDGGPTGGGV
jgi:3',5'-cyclic AMP phosphodiesterase CpdA